MQTAKSSLKFNPQDDKMLSCIGWFISIMVYCLNINVVVFCLLVLGVFSSTVSTSESYAYEPAFEINSIKQNELINWLEAKSAKYARYKLSYPSDGVIHAKGIYPVSNTTVKVNIIEINKKINPKLEIKPAIASDYLNSRVKIRTIANKTGAILAVNGGYFKPQTGVPLGALVIDNELLTGSIYDRVALGINSDDTFSMGKTDINISLKNKKFNLKIDNINQPRMLSTHTLIYTDKWGKTSPAPPKYGTNVVIKNGVVSGFYKIPVNIPAGGYVVSGPENVLKQLMFQKNLSLDIKYPKHFSKSTHIISGGPYLIKEGEIYIDVKEEKLTSITGKNPRTLIGYTKNNDLIIATVDGRESHSIGMSLYESAKFMQKLGCINAMNLDGGSSTVMYLNGQITNTPPVEGGIPISGALTVGLNSAVSANNTKKEKM